MKVLSMADFTKTFVQMLLNAQLTIFAESNTMTGRLVHFGLDANLQHPKAILITVLLTCFLLVTQHRTTQQLFILMK